jgi:hypothetical protein
MADVIVELGPWPLGVNNVDDAHTPAFQPATPEKPAPAFLRAADNVDVDRSGGYQRRQGRTKRMELTDGHSGISIGGMLLVVDHGELKQVFPDYSTKTLVAGLGPDELSYAEAGGVVYWSNGDMVGRIQGGQASCWGLRACGPPTLTLTAGNLRAGRYLVATTVVVDEIESGSRGATAIDVPENCGILVDPHDEDPLADTIEIYCSDCNGSALFWMREGSTLINQVGTSTDLFDGLGAYPPPAGQIVRAYNGRILVAAGSVLYWSEPLAYHRFHVETDFQMFSSPIVLLEPMTDGFYLAVEDGATYWVAGAGPENWSPVVINNRPVCSGQALRLPGRKLPWAQTEAICAVWGTADGWAVGLPNGTVKYPTDGRIAVDTHTKATLAYREEGGLRQILMSLRDKSSISHFGIGDTASAVVYKADGSIQ